ncbi:MAG: hypothetical protein ACTH5C_19870 [Pseudoalteromonas prydzensis]|uniref:hypothetical protein n=1 Tax=Pseudoalteromonas prydzensis TaxID=182141 RepID=UPI003F95CCD0
MNSRPNFFNKSAIVQSALVISLFLLADLYLLNFDKFEIGYSISFYLKCFVLFIYLLATNKFDSFFLEKNHDLTLALDTSAIYFFVWLLVTEFIFTQEELSKLIGLVIVVLLFGSISFFIEVTTKLKGTDFAFINLFLVFFVFFVVCFAGVLIFSGDWVWNVMLPSEIFEKAELG